VWKLITFTRGKLVDLIRVCCAWLENHPETDTIIERTNNIRERVFYASFALDHLNLSYYLQNLAARELGLPMLQRL
jgi:hypothetical protein